jgi:transposase
VPTDGEAASGIGQLEAAAALAPQLLAERGCGVLTAAKLIGEIAGIGRFSTDAKLARLAGSAPAVNENAR